MAAYSPVTLTSGGVQNQGADLLLLDSTSPPSSSTSVLVVVGNQVDSSGRSTALPLVVSSVGALSVVVTPPGDGYYTFQAVRVELVLVFPAGATGGDVVYSLGDQALYQFEATSSQWVPLFDSSFLVAGTPPLLPYLHLTGLTLTYNRLLLRFLYYKLGPVQTINEREVELLDGYLGVLERGLEGSKYLFQDGNYPEAARLVELLTLSAYL